MLGDSRREIPGKSGPIKRLLIGTIREFSQNRTIGIRSSWFFHHTKRNLTPEFAVNAPTEECQAMLGRFDKYSTMDQKESGSVPLVPLEYLSGLLSFLELEIQALLNDVGFQKRGAVKG